MKLKIIQVNGYNIAVDESAEIKEGDYVFWTELVWTELDRKIFKIKSIDSDYVWFTDNECLRTDALDKRYKILFKILFADPELNLDLPIIPDFEQFEVEQLAKQSDKSKCKHFRREHTKEEIYDSFEEGFIAGYNHNKAKYTEEDLRKAYQTGEGRERCSKTGVQIYLSENEFIQSLKKLPKYIVVESESEFNCSFCDAKNLPKNHYCKSNCTIHGTIKPKLITIPDGKQTGIIKELIW